MKKNFKLFLLLLIIAGLTFGLSYVWRALPIISGYGAKNLCSCVYVSGRTEESVINNEMGGFPLSLGSFEIHNSDSSATGSVFGLAGRKAIYRKGLGCTLIAGLTENEVRSQKIKLPTLTVLSDSLAWPFGSASTNYLDSTVDLNLLNKVLSEAFEETDPDKPKNTRAVVVVYKDHIIGEKYTSGFDPETPQLGWSMTKSITNALVGILVKEGRLKVDQPAPVAQWGEEDDPRNKITIDNLLRMSSGLQWEEDYAGPSGATNMLFKKADMGGYAASFPLEDQPGTVWYYSSGTSNILSKIIREKTGAQYYQFVKDSLLNRIGMTSATLEPDASGTYVGSSYMYATPRDWAKFGLLYLHDGMWDNQRILPEGWVNYSIRPTSGAVQGEYGAHFWLNAGSPSNPQNRWYPDAPASLFSLNGYEGQRVFILPSYDLVIVRMGLSKSGNFDFNQFLKGILAGMPAQETVN